ncbi:DUF3717 domain-containing protein [Massilia eurypsychrophila]|jgi:hypothetical protein|uniref:DUF3717 domain-containing protein n=1 Tax=Massilia eurypsychrophila TaxID=1485217 RepID=UPI0015D4935C|nr:DUF3717 domain-containing protein [Massilia eurypsychrophila]
MVLTVQELEAAINFWRHQAPARGNEYALSREVNVLARAYALMIFNRAASIDIDTLDASVRGLIESWRATNPHTD